ncbi:WD40 repeat-like protein [Rickenella mellea]|uniref:Protein HIR n=1 Tax=Rickenella mellea TaxID=50990 RepID=A0A4Y7PXW2_9AGAM|nr:WD40 repeat-like protein [Rickenella mellea]
MRFTKPEWVIHQDTGTKSENTKRLSIFSVHVHPDGSRIATGGLDARIRIWSTRPILNPASEASGRPPKSLCTLTMHTGPVLTVRWAHSGRWLASGSDDEIVMIWDLDPSGSGKVWGSDEVNVEGWKPLKRLPGHESDVTDLAWAPEDRYLASVGLDSQVMIWCGYTLDRLRKLDQHQGFVKGVCWDPVGEFLATQSDDKTVKIWRTTDWALEAEISKPFEDSPGSTFFRRLSWSPDGAHITASNAMNNNGFVFVAAVIARNTWTSEISLVGHENTVEVAAYNPHIFLRNAGMPVVTSNICSVVALGADDRSVSVWQTKSARPLIVAKEVFERQILDLSWSWDGLTLYAVSSDGTMGVFNFDPDELEGIAPIEAQAQYLQKFGFVHNPLPGHYAHALHNAVQNPRTMPQPVDMRHTTPPPTPPPVTAPVLGHSQSNSQNGFGSAGPGEHVNVLVAKKGKKHKNRIQPTLVGGLNGSGPSASMSNSQSQNHVHHMNAPTSHSNVPNSSHLNDSLSNIKLPTISRSVSNSSLKPTFAPSQHQQHHGSSRLSSTFPSRAESVERDIDIDMVGLGVGQDMGMDVPIDALSTSSGRGRRRASEAAFGDGPKARTLGGDRVRDAQRSLDVREIRDVRGGQADVGSWRGSASDIRLAVPPLKTFLEFRVEDSQDTLEAQNPEDPNSPSEVTFYANKTTQWLDYLSSPALALVATGRFMAVAMEDGGINVYSPTGRRAMPTLCLGSPCSFLEGSKNFLMALTSSGQLHVWNVKQQRATFPPVSVLHLISSSPNAEILSATVRPNGAPLLHLTTGVAVTYDASLLSWVKISDAWWAQGSAHWKGRPRNAPGGGAIPSAGAVSAVETRIAERGASVDDGTPRPKWWTAAMTLGHLETRMHAARMLESPSEYKQALILYAKSIADEGFRGKAEELLRELYGPVYWRPGRTDDGWVPTVLGLTKRDLARDVLAVFARSKTLYNLAVTYQELLKKSATDE